MKAANLLPADRRGGVKRPSAGSLLTRAPLLTVAVLLAVLATAALGFVFHSASSSVTTRNATIRDLDAQLQKLAPKPADPAAASGASRLAAVTAAAAARNSWDGFLWSLSRVMPEDVWLLNLSGSVPTASAATSTPTSTPSVASAPSGFTLTGYTYSQPSVARLMRRLQLLPWLSDVSLVTSTKAALADHTVYQFTVGANLIKLPEVGS